MAGYHKAYDLWLASQQISDQALLERCRQAIRAVAVPQPSAILHRAGEELAQGLSKLLGEPIPLVTNGQEPARNGTVVVGRSAITSALGWDGEIGRLKPGGFLIRSAEWNGCRIFVIAGSTDAGALYGVFRLLGFIQEHRPVEDWATVDEPAYRHRLINHWDNWEPTHLGSVERGYAGDTLWKWDELPQQLDPRYRDYARANASLGINGIVVNNVNAQVDFIRTPNLAKIAALASVFREYGIVTYLSIRFDSPMVLGGLPVSDPLDLEVIRWWEEKVREV